MKYRESASKMDWLDLWLNKFSAELAKLDFSPKQVQNNYTILRQYLSENPGNPRAIEIDKLKRFVSDQKIDVAPPLVIFYDKIARSEKHLELLAKYSKASLKKKKSPKPE